MSSWKEKYEAVEAADTDHTERMNFIWQDACLFALTLHEMTGLPMKAYCSDDPVDDGADYSGDWDAAQAPNLSNYHSFVDLDGKVLDALGVTESGDLKERYKPLNEDSVVDIHPGHYLFSADEVAKASDEKKAKARALCELVLKEAGYAPAPAPK